MNVKLYVFFGALVVESEITTFMKQINIDGHIYGFIKSYGLEYQKLGNTNNSHEIIVGKEMLHELDASAFRLKTENGIPKLLSKVGTKGSLLQIENEKDIREKLYKIGIYAEPQYYLFINYEA